MRAFAFCRLLIIFRCIHRLDFLIIKQKGRQIPCVNLSDLFLQTNPLNGALSPTF